MKKSWLELKLGKAEVNRGKHLEDPTNTQKVYQTMINITHCIEELLDFSFSPSSH